jgi:predicted SprT family Zn-dependent metalloprotease
MNKVLDKINPDIIMKCYSDITKLEKIHKHFSDMKFENKQDRILIYDIYVNMLLPKCMKEKGYSGLSGWSGNTAGKLRTSGGNCNYKKNLIQVANWIIESDITKFEDLKETILHEIAHANTWLKHGVTGHGPLWVHEAKLIGCTGDRCLPKKYSAVLFESVIYKCLSISDKCICVKTGSKQSLNLFSKKIPKLVCKKHRLVFEYIETKPFEPEAKTKIKILEDFRKQHNLNSVFVPDRVSEMEKQYKLSGIEYEIVARGHTHRFGTQSNILEDVIVIEDGDVIEINEDGDVYDIDPQVCLKYD